MLIKWWMTKDPITIEEDTPLLEASRLMKEHNIRRLPVLKEGKLVGIVTDRDIKAAMPSKASVLDIHELYHLLSEIKIGDIMTPNPIVVHEEDTIECAAVIMLEKKISGLPVVDKKQNLVGIITEIDIFKALITISGAPLGGVQFAFVLDDYTDDLKKIKEIIRKEGGKIISLLTIFEQERRKVQVFMRVLNLSANVLKRLKYSLEKKFNLLYVVPAPA